MKAAAAVAPRHGAHAVGGQEGRTPLYAAATRSNFAIVLLLLENGADNLVHDRGGRTPESYARSVGNDRTADWLAKWQVPGLRDVRPPAYEAERLYGDADPEVQGARRRMLVQLASADAWAARDTMRVVAAVADLASALAARQRPGEVRRHKPRARHHSGSLAPPLVRQSMEAMALALRVLEKGVPGCFSEAVDRAVEEARAGTASAPLWTFVWRRLTAFRKAHGQGVWVCASADVRRLASRLQAALARALERAMAPAIAAAESTSVLLPEGAWTVVRGMLELEAAAVEHMAALESLARPDRKDALLLLRGLAHDSRRWRRLAARWISQVKGGESASMAERVAAEVDAIATRALEASREMAPVLDVRCPLRREGAALRPGAWARGGPPRRSRGARATVMCCCDPAPVPAQACCDAEICHEPGADELVSLALEASAALGEAGEEQGRFGDAARDWERAAACVGRLVDDAGEEASRLWAERGARLVLESHVAGCRMAQGAQADALAHLQGLRRRVGALLQDLRETGHAGRVPGEEEKLRLWAGTALGRAVAIVLRCEGATHEFVDRLLGQVEVGAARLEQRATRKGGRRDRAKRAPA